jgi:hypothetical protein
MEAELRTLFWRTAPVLVRRGADKEEVPQELNVRLLAGSSRGSQAVKVRARPPPRPPPRLAAALDFSIPRLLSARLQP